MEIWYLVLGIGGLLIITSISNSIAETIEYREQQKQLKIMRIRRRIDELSDYLDTLQAYQLPDVIHKLLLDEIIVRLEEIETINEKFHGIQSLIDEAKARQQNPDNSSEEEATVKAKEITTEKQLQELLSMIRSLTAYLASIKLKSTETPMSEFEDALITFRFEKLNTFYNKLVQQNIEKKEYKKARENAIQIQNTITISGHRNSRLQELLDHSAQLQQHIKQLKDEEEKLQAESIAEADKQKNSSTVNKNQSVT